MYDFKYHRPETVRQAANLLVKNEDAKLVAGGHTLVPVMKQRLASPPHLVDLSHIEGLNTIEMKGRSLVIGATATHFEVANSAIVGEAIPALAELAGALPTTGADVRLVVRQPGGQGQQQRQGVLGDRGGAVALAVADAHALGACGFQVDVVGAGGADQHQLQLGAGGQDGGVQHHLVDEGDLGAGQARRDLVRSARRMEFQFVEHRAQGRRVQIAQVERGIVEEHGANGHDDSSGQGREVRA